VNVGGSSVIAGVEWQSSDQGYAKARPPCRNPGFPGSPPRIRRHQWLAGST